MLTTILAIKAKVEATGKLPPFTAKVENAIEAEAVRAAELVLAETNVEVTATIEARAYKGERRYNGVKLPWVAVTFVNPSGTKEEHLTLAEACKAAGMSPTFCKREEECGFMVNKIPLFYPYGPGEL